MPVGTESVVRIKSEFGAKIMLNLSQTIQWRCFFCVSFLLFKFHTYLYYTILSVPCSLVTICCASAELLALSCVLFSCVLELFHMVSWVRCDICMYRFLIFAFFITFIFMEQSDQVLNCLSRC